MKINRISIVFCLLLGSIMTGCSSKEEEIPEKLDVSLNSLQFASVKGEQTVKITATRPWAISEIPSWLKIEPASGEAGTFDVRIAADANPEERGRDGRLLIISGTKRFFLPVFQREKGVMEFSVKKFVVFGKKQKLAITYSANVEPEVVIPENARTWLSLERTRTVTENNLVFSVEENTINNLRTAEVYVVSEEDALRDTLLIKQYPDPVVKITKTSWFALHSATELNVELECNIPLEIQPSEDYTQWLRITSNKTENGKTVFKFALEPNTTQKQRFADFRIFNEDCAVDRNISLAQMFRIADKDAIRLCRATHINDKNPDIPITDTLTIVFVADGFTMEEIESGLYDRYARSAYEAFFSVEPYKSMKDYFNAYLIYAVSNESGISDTQAGITKDTRFHAAYTEGYGSAMSADFYPTIDFVKESIAAVGGKFVSGVGCVVLIAHGDRYGGTCLLARSTNEAVAICPTSKEPYPQSFEQLVIHEAGGHGFGKLADEYSGFNAGTIDPMSKKELESWQSGNHYLNVSLGSENVPWKPFIGNSDYPEVGVFEGGYYAKFGVWRSSETSVMNTMEGGFNAYSRYLIWKRAKTLYMESWFPSHTSIPQFMQYDAPKIQKSGMKSTTARIPYRHISHTPPVLVD